MYFCSIKQEQCGPDTLFQKQYKCCIFIKVEHNGSIDHLQTNYNFISVCLMLVMCDIKLILTSDLKGVGLVCCHASAVVIKVWQLILSVYTGCFSLSVQTNVMSLNYSFLLHSLEHHPKTKHSSLFYLAFCRPLKLISSPQENFHYCNDKTRTRR